MRRTLSVTIAVLAVAFATAGASLASQASAIAPSMTLNFISRATAINDLVDIGPPGFTPGDLYVFSDRYFSTYAPDRQIGSADGRCVLIDPGTFRFDCSGTITLPDGDIMLAGTLMLVEGATSMGAIVGGTGVYRRARGEAGLLLGPLEGPHDVSIELILNP